MADQESSVTTRTCTYCGETKPIEAFKPCKNKRGKLYRRHRCRACKHRPRPQLPDPYTHQTCKTCGKTKPLDAFHPDPASYGGYRHQCRACRAVIRRARYTKNPEPHKEAERRRRIEQPATLHAYDAQKHARRKFALAQALCDLTAQDWEDILAAYKNKCVYCGQKMNRLTKDHITPLSKGGHHTKSNVVPACRSCNCKKGARAVLQPVQPLLL